MTFRVTFARPDFALLASDTRTTWRPAPDAPATRFSDDGVKITPWGTGWISSSPSNEWRDALLAGMDRADAMRELEARNPALAQVVKDRQLTAIVGSGAGGCFRCVLDWRGRERFPGPQHPTVALCPNGSDPATMQGLLDTYQRQINGQAVAAVLEATTRLYAAVYAHCGPDGTVSPLVSIGLVWRDGRRELLGPMPHDAFLNEVAHV